MPRFKFDLQRILDIRATQERLRQNELAMERKKEHEIILKIERLKEEQSDGYVSGQKILAASRGDIRTMIAHQRYLESLERKIARTYANLDTQREAVEAAREALVEASRKRKLLEKLKDKRLAEFKKEEGVAEQKIIDEVGGTQSARRLSQGREQAGRPADRP